MQPQLPGAELLYLCLRFLVWSARFSLTQFVTMADLQKPALVDHQEDVADLDKAPVIAETHMRESRMTAAILAENPKPFRPSFLRLYACIFVGYLCSATNGFDANTFGSFVQCRTFPAGVVSDNHRRLDCNEHVHGLFWHHRHEPRPCRSALCYWQHCRIVFRGMISMKMLVLEVLSADFERRDLALITTVEG